MRNTKTTLFILLTVGICSGAVHAQLGPNAAFTPSKSKDLVHAIVTTPENQEFQVAVRLGEWIRIQDDSTGEKFGYLTRLGSTPDEIVLEEYSIRTLPGGESTHWTGRSLSNVGSAAGDYLIEITAFERDAVETEEPETTFEQQYGTRGICCVSCSGSTVCGCAVLSSHCGGTCCSGSCCDENGSPMQENKQ